MLRAQELLQLRRNIWLLIGLGLIVLSTPTEVYL